jgi:hypothetical protein
MDYKMCGPIGPKETAWSAFIGLQCPKRRQGTACAVTTHGFPADGISRGAVEFGLPLKILELRKGSLARGAFAYAEARCTIGAECR